MCGTKCANCEASACLSVCLDIPFSSPQLALWEYGARQQCLSGEELRQTAHKSKQRPARQGRSAIRGCSGGTGQPAAAAAP